jgi:hypothetical protein
MLTGPAAPAPHCPDLAGEARHLGHGPARGAAEEGPARWHNVPGPLAASGLVIGALSPGDGVDRAPADSKLPGNLSLREDILAEQLANALNDRRCNHRHTSSESSGS